MIKVFCYAALAIFALSSCVSLHTPTQHFTPCFTNRVQLEAEGSIGNNNAAFNLAVSPLRRFSVIGGMQSTLIKTDGANFQNNAEFGIGHFRHGRNWLFGINTLYGQGSYRWDYSIPTDSVAYTLITSGNYQKGVLQPYILFTNNTAKPKWLLGFSLKQSFYFDNLKSVKDFGKNITQSKASTVFNPALEPCIFFRKSFLRFFYYNIQFGVIVGNDETLVRKEQLAFGRFGIGVKI